MDGAIVVDKSPDWTSHDVVQVMRRLARTKKIGHLGTLDPIATGVLPLLIGRTTRLARFYTRNEKIYEGVVRFGYSTDTFDRTGAPTSRILEPTIDPGELERTLDKFRGKILQTPPAVSAKKVQGKRAYQLARAQVEVSLAPVEVEIHEATVLEVSGSVARLRVHCSGGTYVRALAHDLGEQLGCGAHLAELRRLRSGDFTIEQARTIDELRALAEAGRLEEVLAPAAQLLPDFPEVFVDDTVEGQIRQGRDFAVSAFRADPNARYVKAVNREGALVAIGEAKLPRLYHPAIVL
ncbi:MAG: tRNA pseudouridine(55) synthase TruB [Bryobacteraceae bacterium]